MSLDDNNWQSPYERYRKNRLKINDATIESNIDSSNNNVNVTREGGNVNIRGNNSSDNTTWKTSDVATIDPRDNKKKRRRLLGNSVKDEDQQLLRNAFGSTSEGVTLVDERTYYYQDGAWH